MQNIKVIIVSTVLFISSFLLSFLTLPDIGICWDEPVYLEVAKRHSQWFYILFQRKKEAFSKDIIKKHWHLNTEHPQFSKILMGISYRCFNKLLGEINSIRILSILLYSLTIVLLFLFILKFYNFEIAIFSSLFLLFLPRYFGHSHIISLDIQTSFFALLCVYTFILGCENKKYGVIYAVVQGCALSVRTSLIFLPPLLLLWGYIFYKKKIRWNFYSFFIITPVVYFITNPYLWNDFYLNFYKFVYITIHRADWNRIPVYYLGKQYLWEYPYKTPIYYPWHYPYVIVLVVTPALILLNFFAGLVKTFKDKIGILLFLNFIFPLLIFTPTNVPKYDGERLFLQCFPYLCAIASLGFINILNLLNKISINFKKIVIVVVFLFLAMPFYSIRPFYLEYYNEIIGGISGAHKKGFETTYWGGVVNEKFINYINKNIPRNSKILFSPFSGVVAEFYQDNKKFREDIQVAGVFLATAWALSDYNYLVLIARQGGFTKELWMLYNKIQPIYTISISNVPMIMVYKLR